MEDREGVSPGGPICRLAGAGGATEAQASHSGWQCGKVFCLLVMCEACVAEYGGKGLQDAQ